MSPRERPLDRGRSRGHDTRRAIGKELRTGRTAVGLTLASVASATGISITELSRIERGQAPWVSVQALSEIAAVVGLDLSIKVYPGAQSLRDGRHAALLDRLRKVLHADLRWGTEVPLPIPGDQRAWDGLIVGSSWRYGVEAERNPIDGQALCRRLRLKERDGGVDGVILLLPDTRATRAFRAAFKDLLATDFAVGHTAAIRALASGTDPGGSAIVVL
jgi:transcriptional regulator with XRE-family HTH domain